MSEKEVRRMLKRRSGDVVPSPEAWESIEARLQEPATVPGRPPSRRPLVAVAAAVVVIAGLAVAVGAGPDGRGAVVTAGQSADGSGDSQDGKATTTTVVDPEAPSTPPPPAGEASPHPTVVTSPAAAGAPVLLRATATATEQSESYSQGTITLEFDQPVHPGNAMYLVVYGNDRNCDGPDGNSHVVRSGAGTATITFDATSLGVPTSYVTIVPGFVTGTHSGAANAAVACTGVPTDVRLAPTTTTAPRPPGPVLVGATATVTERQGSYAQGTITVTFDQPVQLAGLEPLTAMYLVVFEDDATCSGPDGNSHKVISGNGTLTLTLDATSLKTPTTYIALAPGFVVSVSTRVPNERTGCTAVPTA